MKATGIVRRIDDLGRVVVPKEIRRTLRLREGTPLEIFTDREGEIILKKSSPMMELNAFAGQYADAMAQSTGLLVCITDRDQVVAAAGGAKKDFFQKPISRALEHVIEDGEKQMRELEERITIGDNRRALVEKYMNIEHLNREMVDTLIDYVTVGRRAKGTKTVPIEIHWNF